MSAAGRQRALAELRDLWLSKPLDEIEPADVAAIYQRCGLTGSERATFIATCDADLAAILAREGDDAPNDAQRATFQRMRELIHA
jgi:hypothetical protein